jgi:hypothetical protein
MQEVGKQVEKLILANMHQRGFSVQIMLFRLRLLAILIVDYMFFHNYT